MHPLGFYIKLRALSATRSPRSYVLEVMEAWLGRLVPGVGGESKNDAFFPSSLQSEFETLYWFGFWERAHSGSSVSFGPFCHDALAKEAV